MKRSLNNTIEAAALLVTATVLALAMTAACGTSSSLGSSNDAAAAVNDSSWSDESGGMVDGSTECQTDEGWNDWFNIQFKKNWFGKSEHALCTLINPVIILCSSAQAIIDTEWKYAAEKPTKYIGKPILMLHMCEGFTASDTYFGMDSCNKQACSFSTPIFHPSTKTPEFIMSFTLIYSWEDGVPRGDWTMHTKSSSSVEEKTVLVILRPYQ